ncbi:CRTAC1 family protein [Thalassobellus suaedae]|uniref:CRTAC1 family protein n=1 Tax=Thalassobellus suaedae TaxID=3074124 RepID=A0ABY9XVA5_9FLAO|nr:CRTAC1 family protein [Flavobacteriaceae bacterium HL-DH14]
MKKFIPLYFKIKFIIMPIKTYQLKNKIIKHSVFIFILLFIIPCHYLKAQTFNRIESVAGLSILEENNGVAIADYNKDGFLDMFVVALGKDEDGISKSHSRLFKNNNDGTFTDATEASGLLLNLFPIEKDGTTYDKVFEGVKHGAFWGDYDNDGFPDLFMTNVYQIYLFHNQGNGTFKDVTDQAGLRVDSRCINTGATWFDYNKDGFLDLYISDWKGCDSNSFYTNNGDGTFNSQIDLFGNTEHKNSLMSIPFDFNNDGWMDLYLANDVINRTNDLFINQNGKGFTEEASKYGLNHARNDMGIAFGDYNNDGFFDMYITDVLMNPLLTNKGDNTFIDLALEQGVQSGGWSWDTVFADFDLDGDEDLLVLNGFEYKGHNSEKNIYFQNLHANGGSKFIDKSDSSNLGALTISVGAGVFDFDNDGDEDIFVTNADRPSYFYENTTTDFTNPAKELHWLKVNLQGTTSNRDAIGTKLVLKTNKNTLYRYYTGKSFLSQNLKSVHFGLANATQIQELKIIWYFRKN